MEEKRGVRSMQDLAGRIQKTVRHVRAIEILMPDMKQQLLHLLEEAIERLQAGETTGDAVLDLAIRSGMVDDAHVAKLHRIQAALSGMVGHLALVTYRTGVFGRYDSRGDGPLYREYQIHRAGVLEGDSLGFCMPGGCTLPVSQYLIVGTDRVLDGNILAETEHDPVPSVVDLTLARTKTSCPPPTVAIGNDAVRDFLGPQLFAQVARQLGVFAVS